jgi:Leucine Rich repeat
LARTPHCASLRTLWMMIDIQGDDPGPFPPEDVHPLLHTPHLGGLEELRIESYRVGPRGIEPLGRAEHLRCLRVLRLADLSLGDQGVEMLLRFPHLANLRVLDLTHNRLSPASGRRLVEEPRLDGLERLGLDFNQGLQDDRETVRLLRRRFGKRLRISLRWE